MKPMSVTIQRYHSRSWFSLLGITLLFLLASCSSVQTPTATTTATVAAATSPTATVAAATSPTATVAAATSPTVDWSSLENKPLNLPTIAAGASCPVTQNQQHVAPDHQYAVGKGPVYLVNGAISNPIVFSNAGSIDPGSTWKISKVFWEVSSSYVGPALIRGGQIDGTQPLNFNGGLEQTAGNNQGTEPILHELRLLGDPHGQWKTYVTFVRIQQAGCYAFQIDGQNFSESIVVQVIVSG